MKSASDKLKRNDVAKTKGIVMLEVLNYFGIDKITDVINRIYESRDIPEDLSRCVFIALSKKPNVNECEQSAKRIIQILMNRARSRIRPEIVQEQCGFVKDIEIRNAIFMLRIIAERAIEMQKGLHLCQRV